MSTATFALLQNPVPLQGTIGGNSAPALVLSKTLPAGSYEVFASVNLDAQNAVNFGNNLTVGDAFCNLMSGNFVIGSATSRTSIQPTDNMKRSFTIFGGAIVPTGGGDVSLWCFSQFGSNEVAQSAAIMAVTLGGLN